MVDVRPFRGWRYNPQKVDLKKVLAPPYDVVSREEKERYLAQDPHNVFHLELGEDTSQEDKYQRAARLWHLWREEEILIQEETPALYLYRLRFSWQGRTFLRRGLIALVELFPWKEKKILPHEKTFNQVTQDRLRLLQATKVQFSQIFCLYHDPSLNSLEILDQGAEELFVVSDEEGFRHEIARLTAPELIEKVRSLIGSERLYIADGHHRYTTALQFMKEMEEQYGSSPKRCFHYMMMYLCPFEEPGLLVLPTHRLLKLTLSCEELLSKLKTYGHLEEIKRDQLESILASLSPVEFLLVHEGEVFRFHLHQGAQKLTAHLPKEIFRLPVAVFTALMKEAFGVDEVQFKEEGRLLYTPWPEEILLKACGQWFGFLLAKTPVLALEEVAKAGLVMPHKSTYFYPKILTGTVFFEIDPQKSPPC